MKVKKKKPLIKRRFARYKITLMRVNYTRKTIRITLKQKECVEIGWDKQWFCKRVRGWRVGEVVLKDDRIIIPFKKEMKEVEQRSVVKKVDPYLTSKTCSRCGCVVRDLKEQVFSCPKCGLVIDR